MPFIARKRLKGSRWLVASLIIAILIAAGVPAWSRYELHKLDITAGRISNLRHGIDS
jgi:hypothetical protein